MDKQTAVEWVIEQLTPSISLQQKHIDDLKEKANKMFEQQIIDAYKDAEYNLYLTGEDYFEKTFKKD